MRFLGLDLADLRRLQRVLRTLAGLPRYVPTSQQGRGRHVDAPGLTTDIASIRKHPSQDRYVLQIRNIDADRLGGRKAIDTVSGDEVTVDFSSSTDRIARDWYTEPAI